MNQAINFFWTMLCFIPVIGLWMSTHTMLLLYACIFISFLSLIIPGRALQLSRNPKFYERAGIKFIRRFVQNGEYANRLVRKRKPLYKLIKNRSHAAGYVRTIKMYERFHIMCFIFFFVSAVYALTIDGYGFFAAIMLSNIIYNICPILLQQYNRARLIIISK